MATPAFRDLDKLKEWFLRNEAPFWSLYSGRTQERGNRIAVNNSMKDMDQSFSWLSEIIESMSDAGGAFHIHTKNSPKEDNDNPTLKERANARLTTSGFHAVFESSYSPVFSSGNGARVSGFNHVGADIDKIVEEKLNQRLELIQKEMEIDDLTEQLKMAKSKSGIMGMTPNEALPFFVNMINSIKGLMNSNPEMQPALKISGVSESVSQDHHNNSGFHSNTQKSDTMPENDICEFSEEEQNRIDDAIERLSHHFDNIVEAIEKLADYTDKNPDMAKMLLKNLN